MKIPEINGVHRPPEGQGQNGVTRAQSWTGEVWLAVGDMAKISLFYFLEISRFTILSRFFVMLVFLFCKLFEHYRQPNFLIIKTKPFKVTKYKKVWWIFRPKWVKIKIFVIIFSLLLKNESKDTHYKYTYYTNKLNSVLFSGTVDVFSSIQETE